MKPKKYSEFKLQYKKLLEIGLMVSLIFHVVLFQGSKRFVAGERVVSIKVPVLTSVDVPKTLQEQKKPEIPRPAVPIASEDLDIARFIDWVPPDWNEPAEIPDPPIFQPTEINGDFVVFEKAPEPVGGYAVLAAKLVYPKLAIAAGIEGSVIVNVWIDKYGEIRRTEILYSIGFEPCDQAAMDAIRAVKWKPALQRDEPIAVCVSVPVWFRLK